MNEIEQNKIKLQMKNKAQLPYLGKTNRAKMIICMHGLAIRIKSNCYNEKTGQTLHLS